MVTCEKGLGFGTPNSPALGVGGFWSQTKGKRVAEKKGIKKGKKKKKRRK